MSISIELFLFVLLLEILVLLSMLISLFIERITTFLLKSIRIYKTNKLSHFILSELETPLVKPRMLPRGLQSFALVVNTLSKFNSTFSYPLWDKVKEEIVLRYTRKKGRRLARSRFWTKRFLSAKNFSLFSTQEDLSLIKALANDNNFLVKSLSLKLLVEKNNEQGIQQILKTMAQVNGYQHIYLKDILLTYPKQIKAAAEKYIKESSDEALLYGAFEIASVIKTDLSEKTYKHHLSNPHLETVALGALANNPYEGAEKLLHHYSQSASSIQRRYAALGLCSFPSQKNIHVIEALLSDTSYDVALTAGKCLLEIGEKGITALKKASTGGEKNARDIAKIALTIQKDLL